MKSKPGITLWILMAIVFAGQALAEVSVEAITVYGKSLAGNLEGNSPDREVFVYLPPGYATETDTQYPVVYLLHGYGGGANTWNSFHKLGERLDAAFAAGEQELIIVAPDAETVHQGSFYSNSVTIGDWESYLADDLVTYIDANYRTIPDRDSRAIAGFSMGGYGTFRMAMKRPDTYGVAYAMSSCCLDPMGSDNEQLTTLENITSLAQSQTLGMGRAPLAFSAAWAPNPNNPPFYIDVPVINGEPQPEVYAALAANAPNIMIHQYVSTLESYNAIGMEIGTEDSLLDGNVRMHELLDRYGIEHQWQTYKGGHGEILGERMEMVMLPFLSNNLEFGD